MTCVENISDNTSHGG